MQIVIKISEQEYEFACKYPAFPFGSYGKIIANGTPLPKGHGVLKDADAMINKLCTQEASELFGSVTCAEIMDFINGEKPIIEADKESEEKNEERGSN